MKGDRLRVLQVIPSLETGGAEKLLVDSIPKYIAKGIDTDLLVLNGTQYPFYNALKESHVNIYSLGLGSVYNPFLIIKIIPYLRKYDVVQVHLFPALYWVVVAKLLSFSGVKLVFTEHSTNNRRIGSFWGKFFDRFFYKRYDTIVSIVPQIEDIIMDHLGESDRTRFRVILNGIDLSKFHIASSHTTEVDIQNFQLIQVSSFNKAKDQATLIRSLLYLPDDIKLALVGAGENVAICKQIVKDLNLQHRVFFLGVRMDVPELLNSAQIVVLSSHFEGFGLVAVEGMASGKPVVASDVPGLSDVVKGAGVLFTPKDEKDLADKLILLLKDKELYSNVVKACKERAEQYDINVMIDKYINLYKQLSN